MSPAGRVRTACTPAGAGARRIGMHQYQQRPRRSPVLIVAVVAAVVVALVAVAVAVVAVAYARSPEAAGWDRATIRACEHVRATKGMDAEALAAIRAAADSGVPELRDAAGRYTGEADPNVLDRREAALQVARWCLDNGLNKP